ncbi:hypothetical protein TIFTF001_024742 [Ficus carica]|uniref:Uncharacterized protein n=1 Tax=Ficus carica TaxID=3494 RepID=A0AA88AW36_FICCA|nr:hypothetical protein TIFTF001_024742 [Ficus carica]
MPNPTTATMPTITAHPYPARDELAIVDPAELVISSPDLNSSNPRWRASHCHNAILCLSS